MENEKNELLKQSLNTSFNLYEELEKLHLKKEKEKEFTSLKIQKGLKERLKRQAKIRGIKIQDILLCICETLESVE